MNVGGQAVLEGVMMRAGEAMITAVRRGDGEIVVRDDTWVPLELRFPFLKWPFVRGALVLVESLMNGMQALSFSAKVADQFERMQQAEEDQPGSGQQESLNHRETNLAIGASLALSLVLAVGLFIYLPHLVAGGALNLLTGEPLGGAGDTDNPAFHAIAGVVKFSLFIGYVVAISRLEDIRRVFQYHGAEHKSIHVWENELELTVANARRFPTLHPRCGTSFVVFVILVSIAFFAIVFPFLPFPEGLEGWRLILAQASVKVPLMFPIAGISYEFIRFAGKHQGNKLLKVLTWPGLAVQHLTTREPDDDQLEVALVSLKRALQQEGRLDDPQYPACSFLSSQAASA
jgi:uncharacterized protein YqhQ